MSSPLLLTGASGFVGGHIAARLAAQGIPVRCLVRASSDTRALEALPTRGEATVELCRGDLTDPASLRRAVAGCDRVIHAAAMVSDWGTVAEIRAANATATAELAAAAVAAGVRRFVHISTTDVYGHPPERGIEETFTPTGFANWYAQTKREAEGALLTATRGTATQTVIVRPATVYGPGSREVVGELARALAGGYLPLLGGGRADAGLLYVENLVDAVLAVLEHPAAAGGTFNVSDGLTVTWREFANDLADGLGVRRPRFVIPAAVAAVLGVGLEEGYRALRRGTGLRTAPLLSRQAVQVLTRDQDVSTRRLRQVTGWTPGVDYRTGLAHTLRWLAEEHLRAPDG